MSDFVPGDFDFNRPYFNGRQSEPFVLPRLELLHGPLSVSPDRSACEIVFESAQRTAA